jgi:hypothetical protein
MLDIQMKHKLFYTTKRTALRSKSKDWLAWNQNNVSEQINMSTRRLLFQ